MNTEAKPSVRRDALVAAVAIAALGLLWLVFRLYWQGLLLLVAAGLIAYLAVWRARARAGAEVPPGPLSGAGVPPAGSSPQKRARADKPRRGKKRRRRK